MPELPEAEVVRRQVDAALRGATIEHVWIGRDDIIRQGRESVSWYSGTRLVDVRRHGKSVTLICERGQERRFVIVELGMTGLLLFTRESVPSDKHVHVVMKLVNGRQPELRYWNARRFGRVHLLEHEAWMAYQQRRFGPDPLTVTKAEFVTLIKSCRGRVKALLLNQRRLAGIGNIYANEALFRSGIHPHARGRHLSKRKIGLLFDEMQATLIQAIHVGGSSIQSFVAPDGSPGQFQEHHRVYQKTGLLCPNGCHARIRRVVTERASFFCPTCQKR